MNLGVIGITFCLTSQPELSISIPVTRLSIMSRDVFIYQVRSSLKHRSVTNCRKKSNSGAERVPVIVRSIHTSEDGYREKLRGTTGPC